MPKCLHRVSGTVARELADDCAVDVADRQGDAARRLSARPPRFGPLRPPEPQPRNLKDGTLFPVEARMGQFETRGGRLLALAREITTRKKAEQHLCAQHAIARILAEAASAEAAAPQILQTLCEHLHWGMAVLWQMDKGAGALRCVDFRRAHAVEAGPFEALTRSIMFPPGSGLPGRVWTSRNPAFIPDIANDPSFIRREAAVHDRLRTAIAFPILVESEVLGIIEVISHDAKEVDANLLESFATIGSLIGHFMERKRAEEALLLAQAELAHVMRVRTLGELTASIAHEVNQPISAVIMTAQAGLHWLSRDAPDVANAADAFAKVIRDGRRAADMLGRVRALLKKTPRHLERLELDGAIRDVVDLTRAEAIMRDVRVRVQLADDLPPVRGDRLELQQVMLNLVINALEALNHVTDRTRDLLISALSHEPGSLLVSVRDWGPGLSPDAIHRVFDAFYTTKPNGTGMRLAICRSIIEAHGGTLWASPGEPHGASFQFILPAAPAATP